MVEENELDTAEDIPRRSRSWWQRKRTLIPAGVIVMVGAVAVGVVLVANPDRPPTAVDSGPALLPAPVVAAARGSVLKIHSELASCTQYKDGSGFVVAPNRVMSPANIVAGATTVEIDSGQTKYAAHVVYYDPNTDVAILEVPGLSAAELEFATQGAHQGTDALVLGYPDGGDFTTTTVRIQDTVKLNGPNIYRTDSVDREVYLLDGSVGQGGPLIGPDGTVLGMVFGVDINKSNAGFALTAKELAAQMAHVGNTEPVSTGACTGSG